MSSVNETGSRLVGARELQGPLSGSCSLGSTLLPYQIQRADPASRGFLLMKLYFRNHPDPVEIDDQDFFLVAGINWIIQKEPKKTDICYAVHSWYDKSGKKCAISMHRMILGLTTGDGLCVDHIDRNGLNNKRDNLRICSQDENKRNRKIHANNKSGYKGVYWCKIRKRWRAEIKYERVKYNLGYFESIEQAKAAYQSAAVKLHGDFCRFN